VSPKIQTERPSGNGIEYAASAPHQEFLKGKLGVQSLADFCCPWSKAAQEIRNNAITMTMTIGFTDRIVELPANMCDNSFRRRYCMQHQCSAWGRREKGERLIAMRENSLPFRPAALYDGCGF